MGDKTAKAGKKQKPGKKRIAEVSRIPQELLDPLVLDSRHGYSARLDAHHEVISPMAGAVVCSKTDLLVFSGRDVTGSNGRATLPIQSLLCGVKIEGVNNPGDPPNNVPPDPLTELVIVKTPHCVATPHGSTPIVLTTSAHSTEREIEPIQFDLVDRDRDASFDGKYLDEVSVEIMAWRMDGSPATKVGFSWVCMVEAGRKRRT